MRKQNGFTLVELLIVIAILGVLSTIGIMSFQGAQKSARDAQRKNDLKVVQFALATYSQDNSGNYINSTSYATATSTLNTGGYLPTTPQDPKNTAPYVYAYNGTTSSFALSVCLENGNDQQGATVATSTCPSTKQLVVTNP